MNTLIFDTETTGFPNPKLSPTHPSQARMIQLAAILFDEQWNELNKIYTLIKPDGWVISEGAFKAHGISQERCEKEGHLQLEVMNELSVLWNTADIYVAHNIKFDLLITDIEQTHISKKDDSFGFFEPMDNRCTMEATTNICKIPFARKNSFGQKYKWPKLIEAYEFLFNEKFESAHDALADVRATARIYRHLVENKMAFQ